MKIYEAKNHLLIHTENINPIKHSHIAAHIIVSLGGKINVFSGCEEYECQGILIPAGAEHKIITGGNPVLVFLYDCTTGTARQIKQIQLIPEYACNKIAVLYDGIAESNYYDFEKQCLELLGIRHEDKNSIDERIIKSIEYIRLNIENKISCQKVANAVYLSQSRFSHLFKQQIGMTFSAYIIYQRLMYVYTQILKGESITAASISAGFSSSAHFADANRRIFGISASSITENLSFIKIQ